MRHLQYCNFNHVDAHQVNPAIDRDPYPTLSIKSVCLKATQYLQAVAVVTYTILPIPYPVILALLKFHSTTHPFNNKSDHQLLAVTQQMMRSSECI